MIKRFLILFITILLLMPQSFVYADVVMGNDFLYKNEDKAEQLGGGLYDGKKFYVNSPKGYIIPKEEPGSEKGVSTSYSYKGTSPGGREDKPYTYSDEVFIFLNGEIIYITHTYLHEGKYWGVMSYSHTYQPPGWIPMDELLVPYVQQDFEAENENDFYTYTGSYDAILSAKNIVEWQWPGSDREKMIVEGNRYEFVKVIYAYRDSEGREWGKTNHMQRWICLSDPENRSKIPSFNPAPKPTRWSPDDDFDGSAVNDVTIWPPADYEKLRSGNSPQSAFDNAEENEFFNQHRRKVQKLDRTRFYANGPDGYVALRTEPGMDSEILTHWLYGPVTYQNGAEIVLGRMSYDAEFYVVGYTYNLNGEYWGLMDDVYGNPHPPGWIPMDHLLVVYTNDDFMNDHSEKLYDFSGDIRIAITTDTFVLWEWPGTDRECEIWGISSLNNRTPITKSAYKNKKWHDWAFNYDEAIEWLYIGNAYKDGDGREWIYIETYWNRPVMGWICVSDPANTEIAAFNPAPKPVKWSPDGIYKYTTENVFNMVLMIVSISVVLSVVVVVIVFRKSKRII